MTHITQKDWGSLPEKDRIDLLEAICKKVDGNFRVEEASIADEYPCILKRYAGIEIRYRIMFEHTIIFGLSDACKFIAEKIDSPLQVTVSELTPYFIRKVDPFAVAEHPILEKEAAIITRDFHVNAPDAPIFASRDISTKILNKLSSRFLSELEWEAATKTGEDNLFPFGNFLPSHDALETWLSFDYKVFSKKKLKNKLCGLFFGEWCEDKFSDSHAKGSAKRDSEYVIKGGGAYFWPWQDAEWVWCMCAMRMPSSDLLDGTAALRPAISIPAI